MQSAQAMIQIRIDKELKDQAAKVFGKIGIDIPTAVRMFFKATVREQRLPFSTRLANDVITLEMNEAEAEKLMENIRELMKRPGEE